MAKIYSTIEVCMSDYSKMSYDEKLYLAKNAYNVIGNYIGKDNDYFIDLMLIFMGVIIRNTSGLRNGCVNLMSNMLPYDSDILDKYVDKSANFYRDYSLFEKLRNLNKAAPRYVQEEMLTLGLVLTTIDGLWADYRRHDILKHLFDLDDYFESIYRGLSD